MGSKSKELRTHLIAEKLRNGSNFLSFLVEFGFVLISSQQLLRKNVVSTIREKAHLASYYDYNYRLFEIAVF